MENNKDQISQEQQTRENLLQNLKDQENISFSGFFLNEQQMALKKKNCKQNENTFTFYCYSRIFDNNKEFRRNNILKLIIYKGDKWLQNVRSLDIQQEEKMIQIPSAKIFYIHINLENQKDFKYCYKLETQNQSNQLDCLITDVIERNLNNLNSIIFDTPNKFDNREKESSRLMLQSYTILYAQNCHILSAQFFLQLIRFIQSNVKPTFDQKDLIVLLKKDENFTSLPCLNKIIYVCALASFKELENYRRNFDYQIDIEDIISQCDQFQNLPQEMKMMFGSGFQYLISKSQQLQILQLPKAMIDFIDYSTWDIQISIEPQENLIEQIDFNSIKQDFKDKIISQITKIQGITFKKILFYIIFIQPSVKCQIDSLNRYFLQRQNKNHIQELIEYISSQKFSLQKQFFLCKELRLFALQNEHFIRFSINMLANNSNQNGQLFQFEDIAEIAIDILKNLRRQPDNIFKNQFANILNMLNNENLSNQNIGYELKNILVTQEEYFQQILSINSVLKNKVLETALIQSMIEILRKTKFQKNEYYKSFQQIADSSFFIMLSKESQKELLVNTFNMITSLLPEYKDLRKLIEDQDFLDCLILLKRHQLITSSKLTNSVIEHFNTLITNINQKLIKFSDLNGILGEDFIKLSNFLEVLDILQKANPLVESLKQTRQIYNQMEGLKYFLSLLKDLEIANYKQIYTQVKDYFENEQDILLEQLMAKQQILKQYSCLEFLYHFYQNELVNNYIKRQLMKTNQLNIPKSDIELDNKIIQLINEIKNHLHKINFYQTDNDGLTLKEVLTFWSYTFQIRSQEQNQNEIIQQVDLLQNYFNQNDQLNLSVKPKKCFIKDIVKLSTFKQTKCIFQQINNVAKILEFQQNEKYQSNIIYLKMMIWRMLAVEQLANQQYKKFNLIAKVQNQYLDKYQKNIQEFLPKECRTDILEFLSITESTKKLIEYLKQLEKDKIKLEDLVDVIDDTSMETDALVQEMMNAKNAIQLIRSGEDDKHSIIQCIASRSKKYKQNLNRNLRLESTIQKCIDNLDVISLKIQSQSDKSKQILQIIKNLEKKIIVDIERLENKSESQLLLKTSKEIYQNQKDRVFSFDDFNLLCNRFKLIKNNKNNMQQQQQEQLQAEDCKEAIYNNLIQVLQLSLQIRLTLDNLKNLGYTELENARYIKENSLNLIIPQLSKDLEQFKQKFENFNLNLTSARQKYLSLNFYPPYSFELILKLMSCINNQNKSKNYLNQLSYLTYSINENQNPNLDKFKIFISEQQININTQGVDIFGQALDILLNLPRIESVENKPSQLEKITEGFKVECRRIKSHNLLSKTIISIFLAHNQKPIPWQIFFCYPKTSILDLEQFAYLAKNSIQNQTYKNQSPLFLICQFENLPIMVQRQFVDKLTEMYEEKEKINLLITYVGNFKEENSMHILQQFKEAPQVDSKLNNQDLVKFSKIESLSKISLHVSQHSGFGKTFQIKKKCKSNNQKLIEVPIYGETTIIQLISVIQNKLSVVENNQVYQYRFHLNLYDLKSDDIHSILFQLLVLRKLSYSSSYFAQIPPNMEIEIEIQNTFLDVLEKKVQYLKEIIHPNNIFKYDLKTTHIKKHAKSIYGADLEIFQVIDNPNIKYEDIQLSFQYLRNYQKISSFQIQNFEKEDQLLQYLQQNQVNQNEAIQLIKDHFLYQLKDNFSFYHIICILKFFCKQVVLFHKTIFLQINYLKFQGINVSFRQKVFEGIIKTSVPYSCQIMSNNFLSKEQEMNKENLPYFDTLGQRNNNIKGWDDNLGQADDFFITFSQSGTILPIFQKKESVPQYLLNFSKSLNYEIKDWNKLENIKEQVLINLCTSPKNIKQVEEELQKNYQNIAITKTIARKICFLYIKINSDIPTLIMGETGVGKTIIVKYLSSLINSAVFTLNVHAGLTQDEIIGWVNVLIKLSQLDIDQTQYRIKDLESESQRDPENESLKQEIIQVKQFLKLKEDQQNKEKNCFNDLKIILFFDEINTNQNIDGILKELLVEKRMQGEPLPDNFVPIAAANPYIFKTEKEQYENTDSLKISSCENQQTSKLVYHVFPLAESMNTFIWHFGELLPEDERKIITQMVYIDDSEKTKFIDAGFYQTLIQTITGCQEFCRIKQSIRSVSLRDVSRFLKVFKYFKTDAAWDKSLLDSLLLTVFFTYYCRFNNVKLRDELCYYLENEKNVTYAGKRIVFSQNLRKIVNQQMELIQGILEQGDLYKSIAFTSTLKENLFMILISVLNNIPIIMVGPPGSSKTLCTRLLYDSMKGSKSYIEFFRKLPNLIYKTYQCSTLSTSDSIEKAFKSAKQLSNTISKSNSETQDGVKIIVALILDEIGLAEASKSNPLKVLHRLLEYQENVPLIGLSNWSLDASKMNRVVFCNRPKLSEEELIEAAIALQKKINLKSKYCQDIVIKLAKDSFSYFSQDNARTFFHGTRDFYNCVTFICNNLKNHDELLQDSQETVLKGILRNFGGYGEAREILSHFKLSLGDSAQFLYDQYINLVNPIELIQMNINDTNCRNLMIIANKPDNALQYTERLCKDRLYKVFQGSDLYDDFTEYNTLKMLNEIITCMEEGYLVIMYSLESLYQSFYDLFNQNYVELGAKKFCRIAIGSDSIRSQVHHNFKVIIIAQSDDVYDQRQNYDPPLLNRFEKQYLKLQYLLKPNEIQIKKELSQFIQNVSEIQSDRRQQQEQFDFGVQDMFPIIQNHNKDEFLIQLTLNSSDNNDNFNRIKKSKQELVNLANNSGVIRAHLFKKLDQEHYDYKINSNNFNFRDILDKLSNQINDSLFSNNNNDDEEYFEESKNDIIGKQYENKNIAQSSKLSQNLIIYTTEYKYQHYSYKSIKQKNFMELEVIGLKNLENLKKQVKQFFDSDTFVNLIIISSALQDKITKLIYIKRILQEERQLYEQNQQLEQRKKRPKNFIFVIQLINQHTKFVGFSLDKLWQQIYIEDMSTPQNNQDDIQNYLQPITVVLKNLENGIYYQILQECFPKILGSLNFEKQKLTEENIKQRLHIYTQVLKIKSDQDFNLFIINKIIERIEKKCEVISKIYGKCEWYHLVSLKDKENRKNNKFISSLKQFIFQESLAILIRFFYVAERNNIISSLMSNKLNFQQQDINQIFQMWLISYDKSKEEDKFCDQIQIIEYPFLGIIRLQIDQFKQIYLEKINEIFQIEERKQIRMNGGSYDQVLNMQKKVKQNFKEIIKILNDLTQLNDPNLMEISKIKPLLYFENLHYEAEYQWTESNTVKRITKKILEVLGGEQAIESFHSITWVYEQIFIELCPIWNQCEEKSSQVIFEETYSKFEQRIEKILSDHSQNISKDEQVYNNQVIKNNKDQNYENEDENYEQEGLNIIEQMQSEMLIFSQNLLEAFIIPKNQDNSQHQLIYTSHILKFCSGTMQTIYNCSSAYDLYPGQMMHSMTKLNFIIKITECFTQVQYTQSLIQQLYGQNNELEFINIINFQQIKQNFINHCDKSKLNEFVLRLIWQLLKCKYFNDEFINFDDEILQDIIQSLSNILKSIDYKYISKNQEDSHYFIFSKRILQILVQKMYESFDENEEEQIQNLLEPNNNQSFKKMQKIFEELKIEKIDPICPVITDIIKEYNYYTPDKFLNYICKKQYDEDEIIIQDAKFEKIGKFLQKINQNSQNKTFINIIEFKIIQELCQTICLFIREAYKFDKRQELEDEQVKMTIEQDYNRDRPRKNRLIGILDTTLLSIINQNDQLNPIIPIFLVKILKEIFNFKNLQELSPYLEAFQKQILLELNQNQNIWDNGQLGVEFRNDLKIHKKLTNLKKEIDNQTHNLPELFFNLAILISEVIIDQNKLEFDLMIDILNSLNQKKINTQFIKEIQILYMNLLQNDSNIPLELLQLFITNLVMTTFLDEDSFISKMYNGKIEIEATFIPFMVDSDAILAIYDELKKTTALRRYQCKNCVLQQLKPYIYTILPCCMPINNLGQCPFCKLQPRLKDHYSPDIEPPQTSEGKQEPIFVKELKDYPDYSQYYKRPNFPYTHDVQKIDDFLKNRGRVDPGFQQSFSLIQTKKIRNLTEKEQILFGRIFILSIMCFCCHLIKKHKDIEQANKQLGLSSPNDIFKLIYSNKKVDQIEQMSSWNLLVQTTKVNAQNLSIYFIYKVVKNYLNKQSSKDFTDKLNFTEDKNRIQFESEFVDQVLESKEIVKEIQTFYEERKQKKQNESIIKNIIFNCNIDLLPDKFQYLKQYKHLLRLNPQIQQDSFQRFVVTDTQRIQSNFFKKLMEFREQIHIYSKIQPIQNFIKIFNLKMFDKITRKQSAEIQIQQFVKDYHLEKEFGQFKESWNYMKQQIHDDNIQIGVDCARIELDEVDSEQQKIDIFCYSEDQASRGYPLYLLIEYFQVQHNNFLEQLEKEFGPLFTKFQGKKFMNMNKKNFIPPYIFSNIEENEFASNFFNDYIERQSGHNPYLEYERQEIYDLKELTREFIEEHYQNVTKIEKASKSDLERVQLVNFRFKGDYKAINLVRETSIRVEQQIYPEIQNDSVKPLLFINLQNNEICLKLIDILKTIMQIITKINGDQMLQDQLYLSNILESFEIQASDINFAQEKIKLCHIISVYELVERISFENLFQDINPLFKIELEQNQKDALRQFYDQQTALDIDIFQQAIGRMIVRIFCEENILMSSSEQLFFLLKECEEEFMDFWGMEHKIYYEKQIKNSDWSEKYSLFKYNSPDVISLGQAYNMYREIQNIKDQKRKQEIDKRNNQLKREQIDQEKIKKEQSQVNQFLVYETDKKNKMFQKNKKSFK